jgi:hypothetical protein
MPILLPATNTGGGLFANNTVSGSATVNNNSGGFVYGTGNTVAGTGKVPNS